MNGLVVNKTFPAFTTFDEVDGGRVYVGDYCQGIGGNPSAKSFADVQDLFLCKFVTRCVFSMQVNKSSSPLMSCVFGKRDPLKVLWSVVQFVAVNVVDRQAFREARNESHRYQAMHKHFGPDVAKFGRHNVIPRFANPRFDFSWLSGACKRLLFSVSSPSSNRLDFGAKDAAIAVDKPINALVGNRYVCHVVNGTTGHS